MKVYKWSYNKDILQGIISKLYKIQGTNIINEINNGKKKVKLNWNVCPVYNNLNLRQCLKCHDYGHSSKKCNSIKCANCSKDHATASCIEQKNVCCINCPNANDKFKTKRDTKHKATDIDNCETYNSRKKYLISRTDYPSGLL